MAFPRPVAVFDPAAWYWFIAGDLTRVYSSAAVAYVPVADATYQAWLAVPGHVTGAFGTEQELWDRLNGLVINATPANATSSDKAKDERIGQQLSEVIYQIAFMHENRIRVLEGQPTITRPQFFTRVKGLMK